MEYDPELDYLYWSKPKISRTAQLKKFLEDFSIHVTEKGLIEGLFIEYARGNFISHNKEYKTLIDKMIPKDGVYVLPKKRGKKR
ncbi:MAG TPA: hypothetical protein VJI66_00340 [Candidatus Paceibacterota bacterium]